MPSGIIYMHPMPLKWYWFSYSHEKKWENDHINHFMSSLVHREILVGGKLGFKGLVGDATKENSKISRR